MLAKEPSHGYELRARLARALGPVAEGINEAQMYVTLTRLEKGGFVARLDAPTQRSDRKVYCLTPAGQERVAEWMSDVSWPRPDLAEFHMKLIAAAQGALADPISIIDAQRRDLLRRLRFRVTLNTDNRLMSGVSLSSEFAAMSRTFGIGLDEMEWLTLNGMKSAFEPFDGRLRLITAVIKPGYAALRAEAAAIALA